MTGSLLLQVFSQKLDGHLFREDATAASYTIDPGPLRSSISLFFQGSTCKMLSIHICFHCDICRQHQVITLKPLVFHTLHSGDCRRVQNQNGLCEAHSPYGMWPAHIFANPVTAINTLTAPQQCNQCLKNKQHRFFQRFGNVLLSLSGSFQFSFSWCLKWRHCTLIDRTLQESLQSVSLFLAMGLPAVFTGDCYFLYHVLMVRDCLGIREPQGCNSLKIL